VATKTAPTAADVCTMLNTGIEERELVRRLTASGVWSKSGAAEIIRFMTDGPDPLLAVNTPLPRGKQFPRPQSRGTARI